MNTARKFNHEDVYKQLDSIDMKQTSLLSDLILSPDSSTVTAINYWRQELHGANDNRKATCLAQIDVLERNMMAKAIIVEDLLGSIEITGGIVSSISNEVVEEAAKVTVEELETKETPVIDIATGKPVAGTEVTIEQGEVTKVETVGDSTIDEMKPLAAIKEAATALIQGGKKEDGIALFKDHLMSGNWIRSNGKPGHKVKQKEFDGMLKDLLKKVDIEVIAKEVTKDEAPKDITTNPPFIPDEPKAVDFDNAKLELEESNLKTYQKFYPEDKEAAKSISTFTKSNLNVGEEEQMLAKVYGQVMQLFIDNKVNDAAELTRLFFSERAYDDVQVGKWLSSAQAKTEVKNQLAFLNEAVTLKSTDSIQEIVKMAEKAVKEDKVSRGTLMDWFRSNALNKKLKEQTEDKDIIKDEKTLLEKFNGMLGWLFDGSKGYTPIQIAESMNLLSDSIKEADPATTNIKDVVLTVRKTLLDKKIEYKLNDLLKKAIALAKTENKPLFDNYQKTRINFQGEVVPVAQKNDDIQPNKEFDQPVIPTPDPTTVSPGAEEITPSPTVETVEGTHDFKTLDELQNHLKYKFALSKSYTPTLEEAVKYMLTLNQIEDAKDWKLEAIEAFVKGLTEPVVETPAVEETPAEVAPVVEEPVVTEPIVETIAEPAPAEPVVEETPETITPEEAKKSVDSPTKVVEPAVGESIVTEASTSSPSQETLSPDFKKIHQSMNKKQFETSVREAYVNHKGDAADDTEIFAKIVKAMSMPSGGKFINQIWKNKEADKINQIKNIVNPKKD